MDQLPPALEQLIQELSRLPSVGPKTAQRLAFHILRSDRSRADALAQAIGGATFGWEHLPGAEHVVRLREQLERDGEWSAAYREGLTLPFAKVAALALTLLNEIAVAPLSPEVVRQPGTI